MGTLTSGSVNFSFIVIHNILILPVFFKIGFKFINSVQRELEFQNSLESASDRETLRTDRRFQKGLILQPLGLLTSKNFRSSRGKVP